MPVRPPKGRRAAASGSDTKTPTNSNYKIRITKQHRRHSRRMAPLAAGNGGTTTQFNLGPGAPRTAFGAP